MSIQEEIKAFVDGELSPEMTDQVRGEIERDPALAQQVAHYRLMGDAIRAMAVEPKVIGAEQVLKKVQPRNWKQKLVLIAVPVSIALLSAVLFPVFAQSKEAAKRYSGAADASASPAGPVFANQAKRDPYGVGYTALKAPSVGFKYGPTGSIRDDFKDGSASASNGVGGAGRQTIAPTYDIAAKAAQPGIPPAADVAAPKNAHTTVLAKAAATPPQSSRMVVENGTLEIVVDDVSRAQSEAMSYAKSIGGFSSNSSLDKDSDDGTATAELTLRVPVGRFEAAMDHLKRMAKTPKDISAVHVTGEDVTGQYVDTTARLKEMRAEEDSYLGMLKNTHHMDDMLAVKDRLSDVRQQIESLEAQAATLKDTSALSTIQITFHQRPKAQPKPKAEIPSNPGWADAAWSDAKTGMASASQNVAVLGIYLFVYSPLWIPLAFLGWLGAKRLV